MPAVFPPLEEVGEEHRVAALALSCEIRCNGRSVLFGPERHFTLITSFFPYSVLRFYDTRRSLGRYFLEHGCSSGLLGPFPPSALYMFFPWARFKVPPLRCGIYEIPAFVDPKDRDPCALLHQDML